MIEEIAYFCFYGNLRDFLHTSDKDNWITYRLHDKQAVKDAIEALGVPHPEVSIILVNGVPSGLLQPLAPDVRVEVYPLHYPGIWPAEYSLHTPIPAPARFVLDVHLGKLARSLRMLGFDSLYENTYSDASISKISEVEKRIVLTRDIGLLKHKTIQWGYWLRSQHVEEQLDEVIDYFNLSADYKPLTRCISCNGWLLEVPKETVLEKLPPKTKLYFNDFYQCSSCHRIYWKGSHYERMQTFIANITERNRS